MTAVGRAEKIHTTYLLFIRLTTNITSTQFNIQSGLHIQSLISF